SAESSSEAESQLLHSLSSRPGSECLVRDPRLPGWAHRWLIRRDQSATALDGLQSAKTGTYRMTPIPPGIGEGPVDHPPGRALPLECNAALASTESASTKAATWGQELTARTHHTGVVRKRLAPYDQLIKVAACTSSPRSNPSAPATVAMQIEQRCSLRSDSVQT
uniref:Ig-like domain-containing protein n=1 Tax=Macrostomum lignano TaxID=282301 RepID=A0A1I8F606_9PLAT